jgi:hypothetical protein
MKDTYREDAIAKVFQKKIDAQQQEIEGLRNELSRIREGVGKLEPYQDEPYTKIYHLPSDLDNLIGEKK